MSKPLCSIVCFLSLLLPLGRAAATAAAAGDPINVVLIYVDDMGWKDLSSYGSTFYETPNIDGLASTGLSFLDAYSACNVCSPSRHALLTGKYPARTHFTNVANWPLDPDRALSDPIQDDILNDAEVTLAEVFHRAGYRTGFFGKWHMLDENPDSMGNGSHGFDVWNQVKTEGGWQPPVIVEEAGDPKEVREITDLSIDFARAAVAEGKPFFLYMAHNTVHVELQTTPGLFGKYSDKPPGDNGQTNPYMGGMIEQLDTQVGRFLEALEALGVAEETCIIFTSDNGGQYEQFGEVVTRQTPLRDGKGSQYEGGTRVPLIINWPGITHGGTSVLPTIQVDLYPTLLDIARLEPDPAQTLDGFSLVPVLDGSSTLESPISRRTSIYWHYPHYKSVTEPYSSIRKGDWKLIVYHEDELSPYGGKGKELFNLREDIGETHDLSQERPDKLYELYGELIDYREAMGAQMPTVNPDYRPEGINP